MAEGPLAPENAFCVQSFRWTIDYYELRAVQRGCLARVRALWLCCIATSDDGESRAGKVEIEGDSPHNRIVVHSV